MGLDMFIQRKKDNDAEELYYWRKAYPIMDWFENYYQGIENLQEYPMTKEDLINLKDYCEEIHGDGHFQEMKELETVIWTEEEDLMEWFDYNMETIRRTKEWLNEFLSNNDEDYKNIIFIAWW